MPRETKGWKGKTPAYHAYSPETAVEALAPVEDSAIVVGVAVAVEAAGRLRVASKLG